MQLLSCEGANLPEPFPKIDDTQRLLIDSGP